MTSTDSDLSQWIGRREVQTDWITPSRVAAWRATLDHDVSVPSEGDRVPASIYWTLFPPLAPTSRLSADGHARRGDFLPPVTLPRRMWAGSRLTFNAPLRVGAMLERESGIDRVETKQGRQGELVFVTVRHVVREHGTEVLTEEQDLVYRGIGPSTGASYDDSQRAAAWTHTIHPNEALLFRYSALTFNTHRIHYDRPYAMSEGYPGLVVHGPLIATLLLDLLHTNMSDASIERFQFRAKRPAFDGAALTLCGAPDADPRHIHLWSLTADRNIGVEADAWIH